MTVAKKRSAGILLYRRRAEVEVLLVHPGGPFWAKKDLGAWSIPKGEHDEGEDGAGVRDPRVHRGDRQRAVARASSTTSATIKQKAGKIVQAWALEGDLDADDGQIEHVFDAMAAALGADAGVPGGRPRRVVRRSTRRVSESTPRRPRFSTVS